MLSKGEAVAVRQVVPSTGWGPVINSRMLNVGGIVAMGHWSG